MQQDWLLRMIAQLGAFIAGITQLRQQKQWDAVHEQIADGIGRFVGLTPSLVHAISEDDLIQLLSTRGGIDLDRWWALAELLREEGLALEEQGDGEGAERALSKSLRLSLEVLAEAEETPKYLDVTALEDVIDRKADRDLNRSTRLALVEYLVNTGRYDTAENVVLWAIDGGRPDATADARDFYERLRRLPDDSLEAGGLSRDEVIAGLAAITTE
jgi:hypothetical protein